MPAVPFGLQSYQHRALPLSAQRMVNCYLEAAPPLAKTPAAVIAAYGIADWAEVGNGPLRGGLVVNAVPYIVSGHELLRLSASGTATVLGQIPGDGLVDMAGDGISVLTVFGGLAFIYDGMDTLVLSDADFPGALWVEFLDGWGIIGEPHSGRVWTNETPYDWSAWNALDFATAEGAPDDIVGGIVDHREVFLFGRESTEVWYNSGDADFVLARMPNGFIEYGLLSTRGPAKHDNTVFFPAHDGTVRKMDGYTPVRVSTHAIEQAIEDHADKACYGLTWTEAGHAFYGLTFSWGTLVYDISTQLWHERESYGQDIWRPAFIIRAFDKWLVGDAGSNKLGELSADTFAEWGQVLRASATSPPVAKENRRIFHRRGELVFEQGVGLTIGQGEDPQVMLDWSNDGGRTWAPEKWRPLGKIGEFRRRAIWTRMGSARDRVYRYAISDPVRRTLIQAHLDFEVGGY